VRSVQQLTSELVTNSYRHAGSGARVTVSRRGGIVRVEVHDSGHGPIRMLPLDVEQQRGRGLRIVDAMARRWGSSTADGGTTVWFELDVGAPVNEPRGGR
jgi:two-component sensor histidine kinase